MIAALPQATARTYEFNLNGISQTLTTDIDSKYLGTYVRSSRWKTRITLLPNGEGYFSSRMLKHTRSFLVKKHLYKYGKRSIPLQWGVIMKGDNIWHSKKKRVESFGEEQNLTMSIVLRFQDEVLIEDLYLKDDIPRLGHAVKIDSDISPGETVH